MPPLPMSIVKLQRCDLRYAYSGAIYTMLVGARFIAPLSKPTVIRKDSGCRPRRLSAECLPNPGSL